MDDILNINESHFLNSTVLSQKLWF